VVGAPNGETKLSRGVLGFKEPREEGEERVGEGRGGDGRGEKGKGGKGRRKERRERAKRRGEQKEEKKCEGGGSMLRQIISLFFPNKV
jgi:hypothetical protein